MEDKQLNEDLRFIKEIFRRAESEEGRRISERTCERLNIKKPTQDRFRLDIKEEEIMKAIKASYIANRFFGRSGSWICHKLNNDLVNGKPEGFTAEERLRLKDAFSTMAREMQELSDCI